MNYFGEIISLTVAVSWTATAMIGEVAGRKLGPLVLNVVRMIFSLVFLALTLWFTTGHPLPQYADGQTWLWLSLSGFMGYVFGDYCLFNAYMVIGSRFGQLFMTLASPFAALSAWVLMGESMTWLSVLGMLVCMLGIGISIMAHDEEGNQDGHRHIRIKLPMRGILLGIGAGAGQGIGLVLSKVGMTHYQDVIPAAAHDVHTMIPFASTMMRSVMGLIGFTVTLAMAGQMKGLRQAMHNASGLHAAMWATILGPFIGVSLSLMAVQYTNTGVAQTLMALTPVLIIWPSRIFFHTRITWREVLGAVIAVLGVTLFFI